MESFSFILHLLLLKRRISYERSTIDETNFDCNILRSGYGRRLRNRGFQRRVSHIHDCQFGVGIVEQGRDGIHDFHFRFEIELGLEWHSYGVDNRIDFLLFSFHEHGTCPGTVC